MENQEPDDVVVATVQGSAEEAQIVSFLEGNGIPARIRGDVARKVYGFTIDGLGAVQVIVPRDRAIEARDLLERADRGELEISEEGN